MHLSLFSVATFAAFLHSPTIILAHTNHSTATSSAPASTPSASLLVYTALISAVKDKAKVEHEAALLATYVQNVKANEPDVLVFEVDVDRNRSQFLTYEVYKDQAAVDLHLRSSYIADLNKAQRRERLLRKEVEVFKLEGVARFIREAIPAEG